MSQLTFSEAEFVNKKHRTRREVFLERMDQLIPWQRLEQKIAKHYPKGENGRPPYPLAVMLRVHCLQLFYNLSDPGMQDALYEIESMRRFAGLRLSERLPDETTILNFRHFLESHRLGKTLFEEINRHLKEQNLSFREGTIVDATIISAPSSTQNQSGERDPQMHQTRKGQQWYFGMKLHIGVDETLGLIHSLETTPANASDIHHAGALLHGEEERVWGDAGYTGIEKREEHQGRDVDWQVALRPGKRAQLPPTSRLARVEKTKASVRAKVEHPFRYIKVMFGYAKVRYRGLAKNENRLHLLAGFTNLLIGRKYLLA
ncbi:MAG: IS5 family transposase [Pseudonocardiaceae bacterium]